MIRPLLILLLLSVLSLSADYQRTELATNPEGRMGTLHLYRFSSTEVTLKIIPRGKHHNLADAMKANQCLAGCNGGFFDPEYKPLGQVIASGEKSGHRNLASSLTSGVIYQQGDTLAIERAKTFYKRSSLPANSCRPDPFSSKTGKQ